MGSIFKYSGLTTKIRAMRADFITKNQYAKLSELSSVGELVGELKSTGAYAKTFENVEATDIHRGKLEKLVTTSKYRDFEKMYRFANMEQRRYMKLYFIKYEIEILKKVIIQFAGAGDEELFGGAYEAYGKYPDFNIGDVLATTNIDELVQALKDTVFYNSMRLVQELPNATAFDYEIALDLFFFTYLWKKKNKIFKGDELKHIGMNLGTEIDTLNIMWIHRAKRYYHLSSEKIYSMIIPVYYKLRKHQIKSLVESEDENSFLAELSMTHYGKCIADEDITSGNGEKTFERYLIACYQKLFKLNPYSLSAIDAYLKDKELEIKNLVTLAECIRYGYTSEEILKHLTYI